MLRDELRYLHRRLPWVNHNFLLNLFSLKPFTYNVYVLVKFCSGTGSSRYNAARSNSLPGNAITIKIMSKDYLWTNQCLINRKQHSKSIDIYEPKDAIKVSYAYGLWSDVCKGNETRVPIQYHELEEVR